MHYSPETRDDVKKFPHNVKERQKGITSSMVQVITVVKIKSRGKLITIISIVMENGSLVVNLNLLVKFKFFIRSFPSIVILIHTAAFSEHS